MAELTPHALAMLAFVGLVFALFIWGRWPIATISLGMLAALPLGFTLFPLQIDGQAVDPTRFFEGLASPALVAICALMIVGHGLVVTGALEPAARRLAGLVAAHPRTALLAVLATAASASGVVNDTPVVVLLIPLLLAAARQAKRPAAGLLLPMNYAVLIGGMATTIGTSTNLIVVAIALSMGVGPFGMFSWFGLVALAAIPALAYLWLVAPRLLRDVPQQEQQLSDDVFDAELHVDEGSALAGKPLGKALAEVRGGLRLLGVRRGTRLIAALPSMVLRTGDRLMIRETALRLKELEAHMDAELHDLQPPTEVKTPAASTPSTPNTPSALPTSNISGAATSQDTAAEADAAAIEEGAATKKEPAPQPEKKTPSAVVAQMIVTAGSPLEGRSIRQERLADRFAFVVVGLRTPAPQAAWRSSSLADRRISVGDVLLVQGDADAMRGAQRDGLGLLLDERFAVPRQDKAWIAIAVMAAVVLLAATKTMPIAMAALAGALALVLTRCLSWEDVAQSLSMKVVLLVAASLALGDALAVTGATAWLAQGLAANSQALSPAWLAALLMALMGLVTNFVSNNAAAAIGTPLAVSLAQALGVPAEPFVLAVLFGCNLCYLTPMGYQTNLLVMNAGGYRFSDFLRVGTPLFVIMWGTLSFLLAWRYGL